MFNGIIEKTGKVADLKKISQRKLTFLVLQPSSALKKVKIGGSVCVNGVCLTLVKRLKKGLFFNLVKETLTRSHLGHLKAGDKVNLELPLKAGSRIDGHYVLGHVDGVGQVIELKSRKTEKDFKISFPKKLSRFFVEKGSVAVEGVSLTLGRTGPGYFWVHCIPHTLHSTTLKDLKKGHSVNLEADILSKMAAAKG